VQLEEFMKHKFGIGDLVRFHRGSRSAAGGNYEVCRLLPDSNGKPQYRIRSSYEIHERVAAETELSTSPAINEYLAHSRIAER
jgi:hypothetical protein